MFANLNIRNAHFITNCIVEIPQNIHLFLIKMLHSIKYVICLMLQNIPYIFLLDHTNPTTLITKLHYIRIDKIKQIYRCYKKYDRF